MKRFILCGLLLTGFAIAGLAQTSGKAKNSSTSSASVNKSSKTKKSTGPVRLNNRKIYRWKDGQKATPTGHEATPSNGSQYSAINDSTRSKGKNK